MLELDKIQEASKKQFDQQSANYGKSLILGKTDDISSALALEEGLNVGTRRHEA
jgi:hypothetical protein